MSISTMLESLRDKVPAAGYKYSALPARASSSREERTRQRLSELHRHSRIFKMTMGGLILAAVMFMTIVYGPQGSVATGCEQTGSCVGVSPHIWGQYSPYFSAPSDIDPAVPAQCDVTMVVLLSRHGSRYPTAKKSAVYRSTVDRVKDSVKSYDPAVKFLETYDYELGADELVPLGQQEMAASGRAFFERYKQLAIEGNSDMFIRASGQNRVIMSAENFTTAFYQAQGRSGAEEIAKIVVVSEGDGFNNTLDEGGCDAFENGPSGHLADEKKDLWKDSWAEPIMHRLNEKLTGANLTLEETVYMMDLCPFETIASPSQTQSDFCRLFSTDEWRGYDYFQSLGKWYGYGNGNPFGSTQGVGFVNELIARLTGQPVQDHTKTNTTLDSSPATFPLDRKLYADFSHDNSMTSVYAALGLYNSTADLPVESKTPPRQTDGYSASWTAPFAARMYVEKMKCAGDDEEMVRVLIDDRVTPLQGCGANRLGMCRLSAFLSSQSFSQGGGRWGECSV